VNNLNRIVTDPNGRRYVGHQSAPGAMTLDATNNVEAIKVRQPAAGNWTVEVAAGAISDSEPHRQAVVELLQCRAEHPVLQVL
jgi:hypothetical protein